MSERDPLARLNGLPVEDARAELLRCCGSRRWAERVTSARPFVDAAALLAAADGAWAGMGPADWREAFAAHPEIGHASRDASTREWSRSEQSGMEEASEATRHRLDVAQRAYRRRFGYIFLICATGRGAEEMIEALELRLANDPEAELEVAAGEQRAITRLRLERIIQGEELQ